MPWRFLRLVTALAMASFGVPRLKMALDADDQSVEGMLDLRHL